MACPNPYSVTPIPGRLHGEGLSRPRGCLPSAQFDSARFVSPSLRISRCPLRTGLAPAHLLPGAGARGQEGPPAGDAAGGPTICGRGGLRQDLARGCGPRKGSPLGRLLDHLSVRWHAYFRAPARAQGGYETLFRFRGQGGRPRPHAQHRVIPLARLAGEGQGPCRRPRADIPRRTPPSSSAGSRRRSSGTARRSSRRSRGTWRSPI